MGRLDDRVAIVTGAAQGIGETYASALAGEGARVVLTDIDDCEPAAEKIRSAYQGAEILALRTDVTSEAETQDMVGETVAEFGRVDIMVTNAAIFGNIVPGPFEDISAEQWDSLMAVNVKGPFLCAKAAVPQMRKQKYGKIINIASGTLFKGSPYMLHYVSSKGAILAFTRSLSREVGEDGICVNTLAPGLTMSENVIANRNEQREMNHDMVVNSRAFKRDETPDDLVGALIFLSSADSDFMTGQCVVVDGGSVNH